MPWYRSCKFPLDVVVARDGCDTHAAMDLHELPDRPFQRHPWEVARARFFCAMLGRRVAMDRPLRILDVGAGAPPSSW